MKTLNPKPLHRRGALIMAALSTVVALALNGCKSNPTGVDNDDKNNGNDDTPRTAVPAELVGAWHHGSVSSINFYNPTTGSWANGYGEGLFYKFNSDGTFEYGWQVYANSYGCSSRALVYKKGTVTVDPATSTIQVYVTMARVHGEDSCAPSSNCDRPVPLINETLIWEFGKDEYGNTVLWLRFPDTGFSDFYRQ